MAITIETKEQFEELAKTWGLSADVADRLYRSLEDMTTGASRAGDAAGILASGADKAKDRLAELVKVPIVDFIVGVQPALVDAKTHMDDLGISTAQVGTALLTMVGPLAKVISTFSSLREFGSGAMDASANISEIAKKMEKLEVLTGPLKMAADWGEAAQSGNRVETQLLRLMGSAGELGGTFGELGFHMKGITNRAVEMSRIQSEVGTAMGMTVEQIAPYSDSLQKIPGAFNQVVDAGEAAGGQMHALEASMKVARGTHQEYGDVLQQLEKYTLDFGSSNTEALASMSRMYSATQAMGLRMQDVRSYVENVGDAFKYFGDNTSSSIRILGRFGPTLKDSGLGAKATTELVGKFTQGIQQMDVAQRAFLSGQTGGPGGLTGGLQIEEMLAKGDVADVAEKIEQVMKQQVGGDLITREEAATGGEGAARQFELQRQMLMSGPFGNLAGSPEGASKLIDAMAEGSFDQVDDLIQGKDDALSSAVMDGNTIAERHANISTGIYNEMVTLTNEVEMSNAQVAREFIRPGGVIDETKFGNRGLDAMHNASNRTAARDMSIDSESIIKSPGEGIEGAIDKFTNVLKKAKVGEEAINKMIPPIIKNLAPMVFKATSRGEKLNKESIKRFLQEKQDLSRPDARTATRTEPLFAIPADRSRKKEVNKMANMDTQQKERDRDRNIEEQGTRRDDRVDNLIVTVRTDKDSILEIIGKERKESVQTGTSR